MYSSIDKYRALCNREVTIPIFSKDWWLDAVCGEGNWDVVLFEQNGIIKGTFPFVSKKKYGLRVITLPLLTQSSYLWLDIPEGMKNTKARSLEKDYVVNILKMLPSYNYFNLSFHYDLQNWLPFYWHGFSQTSKYTYIIEDLSDLDSIFREFRANIKTDIRKAEKQYTITEIDDLQAFYKLNKLVFERQNIKIPYTYELLNSLDRACIEHDCRKIIFAKDSNGKLCAACYIVWDNRSAYYMMSGNEPQLRNSGVSSLLIWEAIKRSASVVRQFDFEGSMIESIERNFRAFGATQRQYHNIFNYSPKYLKILGANR